MHGVGLDDDPRSFFPQAKQLPGITVAPDLIRRALADR